jgi:hypothetical protein
MTDKTKPKAKKSPSKPLSSSFPRHPQNPYRMGSGYGLCFDILASHKEGLPRSQLITLYAKESGKPVDQGALWDATVVCSSTKEGDGHRSCKKDTYWVERYDGGRVILHWRD